MRIGAPGWMIAAAEPRCDTARPPARRTTTTNIRTMRAMDPCSPNSKTAAPGGTRVALRVNVAMSRGSIGPHVARTWEEHVGDRDSVVKELVYHRQVIPSVERNAQKIAMIDGP